MKLRDYQIKINEKTREFMVSDQSRGQVYAPTGAGKTVCFTNLIQYAIEQGSTNIAVVHPRIALSQDQLKRLKRDLGTDVMFTSFHSGGHISGDETISEISTTNTDILKTIINQTDRPHVTLSSYQSFHKLVEDSVHFDLIVCDEAHYLVADQYREVVKNFDADKIIFYTATPIVNEAGGMNDSELFGDIIASVLPSTLIRPGYIVAPIIHAMDCTSTKTSDRADIVDIVSRAYVDQYRRVTGWGMPYHQMLVATRDVQNDIGEIESRLFEIKSYVSDNLGISGQDIDIYTISSNGSFRNGRPVIGGRESAIRDIKELGRNAIVCHCDTLAEGIDIDTLCGALMMRNMSVAKFIQTTGRCARPYKGDLSKSGAPKKSLYNVKKLLDKRSKPRCIITIPTVDGQCLGSLDAEKIARAFIAGGWGDLSTFVTSINDRFESPSSKEEFELGSDDVFSAHIIDHQVRESLTDLYSQAGA